MQASQRKYNEIRDCMKPGDVIAFSGKKAISETIKWATRSNVSHVGVVFQSRRVTEVGDPEGRVFNLVVEASYSGVKFSKLSDIVATYDGELWWLPLSDKSHANLDLDGFLNFLIDNEGAPYDSLRSLINAWADRLDFLGVTQNQEDFVSFFCSELVAGALKAGNVIESPNVSEVTPIDLCRFNIYAENYFQFSGEEKRIRGFNSEDPSGWGE